MIIFASIERCLFIYISRIGACYTVSSCRAGGGGGSKVGVDIGTVEVGVIEVEEGGGVGREVDWFAEC